LSWFLSPTEGDDWDRKLRKADLLTLRVYVDEDIEFDFSVIAL
jgi:hypothetical protein